MRKKRQLLDSFVFNRDKYSEQLKVAVAKQLYDFAIILIWKTFMLFLYEKFFQIDQKVIIENWQTKFGGDKKPTGYKRNSLYWANNEDDELILTFVGELFNVDSNVIKTAKALSKKRNTASHVTEMTNSVSDVDSFLHEILKVMSHLQNCHGEYLRETDIELLDELVVANKLSPQDINYLLDQLITKFEQSPNFSTSTKLRNVLLSLSGHLSKNHVSGILTATAKNSRGDNYHQILEAAGASGFFRKLYAVYSEPSEEWETFAKYLVKELEEKKAQLQLNEYQWLFEKFKMRVPLYKAPEPEEHDPMDDIPF